MTTAAGACVPAAFSSVRNSCVAVSNGTLGPQGDPDQRFAVGRHRGAAVGILGEMDDPEPDLRVHLAVSRPAHLGSQHFLKPLDGVISHPRAYSLPIPDTLLFAACPFPKPSIALLHNSLHRR